MYRCYIKKCGLVSVIGPLCCLEIKMGVAEQFTVYKSFSTALVRVQFLRMPYNHTFWAVSSGQNFSVAKAEILYLPSLLTCREGNKKL